MCVPYFCQSYLFTYCFLYPDFCPSWQTVWCCPWFHVTPSYSHSLYHLHPYFLTDMPFCLLGHYSHISKSSHFEFRSSISALLDSHLAFHSRDTEENPPKLIWSAWCLKMCPSLQLPTLPFPQSSFPHRSFRHLPAGSSLWHLHLVTVCVCCPQMLYPVLSCLCGKQYWSLVVKYSFSLDGLHKTHIHHEVHKGLSSKNCN